MIQDDQKITAYALGELLGDEKIAFEKELKNIGINRLSIGVQSFNDNKLKFLKFFCLLGSLSVMSLFFFEGESTLWVGIVFTIMVDFK